MELGGSDAYAILADCDLSEAARAVVDARISNSGQTCIAPKRVIVEKAVKAGRLPCKPWEIIGKPEENHRKMVVE